MVKPAAPEPLTLCYHCGDECREDTVVAHDRQFCCNGCKMVYEIINNSGLCEYYDLETNPGITQKIKIREGKFAFLENDEIAQKLIHFSDGSQCHVTFWMPQMHCSSCIWLLEQLGRFDAGILSSRTNFVRREVTIIFNTSKTTLRKVAELCTRIGYEPHISLKDLSERKTRKYDRARIFRIGIAGFCFGNIMLLSFPEYLASVDLPDTGLRTLFSYLNLGLSLPVFFYCAWEFYVSAFKALRQKFLNIDAPIVLAILITFGRSLVEILSDTGAGYLDSMSGIVFFMLVGRFFQDRSYQALSFDRDYTSYFPISVTVVNKEKDEQVPVSSVKKGDRIRVHSNEIVPADGILFLGKGEIDYSFVTGESVTNEKTIGEIVYAGGRQTGAAIELEVVKEISRSYLTQLWNNDAFNKSEDIDRTSFVHKISRYFTTILFTITISSATYWYFADPSRIWNAVTAILIIACPCALLLSSTFTNGNMIARLRSKGFFVKNASVLEKLSTCDMVVFDKTGTLSRQEKAGVSYHGRPLTPPEIQMLRSLAAQSTHPLSRAILTLPDAHKILRVEDFSEEKGKGLQARINNVWIRLGSAEFTGHPWVSEEKNRNSGSRVYCSIDDKCDGFFLVKNTYRQGLRDMISAVKEKYRVAVLSGDNDSDRGYLAGIFGSQKDLSFQQSPEDKLNYIRKRQQQGHKILMIGDGLNDAGALRQSDVGIAVTDDMNNFSPGCDAILDGKLFSHLPRLLRYCNAHKTIIYGSFFISLLYNFVGLFFAVQGALSPVIAAILMPASSVCIVLFTTGMSTLLARKLPS